MKNNIPQKLSDMTEDQEKKAFATPAPVLITEKTRFSFGLVKWFIACTIAICGSYYVLFVQNLDLKAEIRLQGENVEKLIKEMSQHKTTDWVRLNQQIWELEVKRMNGTNIHLPDLDYIYKMTP